MIEAGFSEKEAMEISGDKARAVLRQKMTRQLNGSRQRAKTKFSKLFGFCGEPGGIRTRDNRIKSAMLYQLSYRPAIGNRLLFQSIICAALATWLGRG
jgi:hypothetical protein